MTLTVSVEPSVPEAAQILGKAFRSRQLVLIVGECRVNYEGRASSTLERGERIAIIKQDGSLMIHRPTGYEPVNWQPPKCVMSVSTEEPGLLMVNASRHQPRETVSIEFHRVSLIAHGELKDEGEFSLHVTEEQMKEAILVAPDLVEAGLRPLEEEKSLGEAGFTDIFAEDSLGNLVVVEIKRVAASRDAAAQLARYLETLRKKINKPIRGILVAPELRKNAQLLLSSLNLEFVKLEPERCFHILRSRRDMKLSQFMREA